MAIDRDERSRDQQLAEEARPLIVAGLRARREPLDIASDIARRLSLDAEKAYRWVVLISEDFERRRRRIATVGIVLLWIGVLTLVSGAVLSLIGAGSGETPFLSIGLVVGAPLSLCGAFISFRARQLVRTSV
jgi:hypothetical protein